MKKNLLILVLPILFVYCHGQQYPSDFRTIQINKKIKEFLDTFDLSSPLKSLITYNNYVAINGKDNLLQKVSTIRYKYDLPDSTAPDSPVSDQSKSRFLETIVKEIIYYKDSIACAISEVRDSLYSIRSFSLENGRWIQGGEDERKTIDKSRKQFEKYANNDLQLLRKTVAFARIPTDTISLILYLREKGQNPEEFLLSKLKKYKLVMYGEIHRRKTSWDLLREVVNDKRFANNTGAIFLEMQSDKQPDLDRFFSNDSIDKELLLNIFRDYMIAGWDDKEKFDFLISVWYLNKNLPDYKKIKILFVDTPRIYTVEVAKSDTIDRNRYMAKEIIKYLQSKVDKRNALFVKKELLSKGTEAYVDFEDIQEMARVFVNGNDCGIVWTPPYKARITPYLKAGTNTITVQVINTWYNRVVGDLINSDGKAYTNTNIKPRFRNKSSLLNSGLMGKAEIIFTN